MSAGVTVRAGYHRFDMSFPPPPPSQPPPPPPRYGQSRGTNGLGIAGIVIACVAVPMIVVLVAVLFVVRGRHKDDETLPFREVGVTTTVRAGASTTRAAATYGTTECPPAGGTAASVRSFSAPFRQCIDVTKKYTAVVTTNKGELTIRLDPVQAPVTVNNFVSLARSRFYDTVPCHRIIPGFVVQCGDPTGVGTGGPGYKIPDELVGNPHKHDEGALSMAHAGANTGGSQFFIVLSERNTRHLNNVHTVFGKVTEGLDIVKQIVGNDVINKLRVE